MSELVKRKWAGGDEGRETGSGITAVIKDAALSNG